MKIYEDYENAPLVRRMIAVGGCVILGIIVLILAIVAASGESDSLAKAGFSGYTIPFYAIVIICGFLILSRVRYAALIASGASAIELVLYFCVQMSTHPDVPWPVFLKLIVVVCCMQLVILIDSFDEEEEEPPAPARPAGPQAPQPRHNVQRNAPRPKR